MRACGCLDYGVGQWRQRIGEQGPGESARFQTYERTFSRVDARADSVRTLGLVAYGMRKGRFSYYLTSFGESRTKKLPTVARRSD